MLKHCTLLCVPLTTLAAQVAAQVHPAQEATRREVAQISDSVRSETDIVSQSATPSLGPLALYLRGYSPDKTGVQDSADAVQRWINACIAANAACIADPGVYRLGRTITVPGGLNLAGAGKHLTKFVLGMTTMTGFNIITTEPVQFRDFAVWGGGKQSAGAAFLLNPMVNENDNSSFENIYCNATWTCFRFDRAAYWNMRNSDFYDGFGPQVVIDNLNGIDTGDSIFTGNKCIFGGSSANTNQVCLRWSGSGGLRVIGNKFLNGYRGLEFKIRSGTTGSLIIASNSIENAFADQIYFGQGSEGAGPYTKVVVNGNELLGFGDANGIAMQARENGPRWMLSLSIAANNIEINGDGKGTRPLGISVYQTSKGLLTGNMVVCHAPAHASVAFKIGNSTEHFVHSGNLAYGCATPFSNGATNQPDPF